jgi:hypothetical protein
MMRFTIFAVLFVVVGCSNEPEPPKAVPITLETPLVSTESPAPSAPESSTQPDTKEAAQESRTSPSKNKSAEPQLQPQPLPVASAQPKASPPAYDTMRKIKLAVRTGRISRAQYDMYQAEIRRKRQVEYDATKNRYRVGKITRAQYDQTIRRIRAKYEG